MARNRDDGSIKRQCVAHKSNGDRCSQHAIRGTTVCRFHGGSTKHIREAAIRRLLEMVDPALAELRKVLTNPRTEDNDRLRAVKEVLDRAGLSAEQTLKIVTQPDDPWFNARAALIAKIDGLDADPESAPDLDRKVRSNGQKRK